MRRALTVGVLAAVALVPVLASPASAQQQLVYVYSDDSGVTAVVGVGTGTIAGATVYYEGSVCVSVGVSRTCTSELP